MDSLKMVLFKSLIAAGGLATVADAHMRLKLPKPYDTPATSENPVTAENFPCQIAPGTTPAGTATPVMKGESQELAFIGAASHGGGSCQLSLTYDNPPTKNSVWKVIHSIHGGCTGKSNLEGHIDPAGTREYEGSDRWNFTIPEGVPGGQATLAWSWINKIGGVNEFYMNCAPIDIQGEGGDESDLAALPDMFVANIPGVTDCTTTLMVNTEYPNPGDSVDASTISEANPMKKPDCGGAAGGGAGGAPAASPAATPAVRGRRPNFRA